MQHISLRPLIALTLAAGLLLVTGARAGDGHDHGDAAPTAAGSALPRFTAISEAFELVGVLDGKQLTLYLDRFADNSPVRGAQLELEIGGAKIKTETHAEGEFEATLAEAPKPGVLPVTATVIAGAETDLLAGELDIHDEHADEAPAAQGWQRIGIWVAGGLVTLGLLAWAIRRASTQRPLRMGGAA
ncbi:hypothetical protein [Rivibacter subsaxonicus]|uniref:Nickel transport protein n=1 Tax=Rivibacter subsaxonicus TaxID=457575 RepID=A0A4Q7VW27_9BURK|nr:hypothetical protein [Rivibacter subsaxonicus]RZU00904.1 hypothetical protein EV670_1617 [Rivibacter subsaxonicus]